MLEGAIGRSIDIGLTVMIASIVVICSALIVFLARLQHGARDAGAKTALLMAHGCFLAATAGVALAECLPLSLAAMLVIGGALGGILAGAEFCVAALTGKPLGREWRAVVAAAILGQVVLAHSLQSVFLLIMSSSIINGLLAALLALRIWRSARSEGFWGVGLLTMPFVAISTAYLARIGLAAVGASPDSFLIASAVIAFVLAFSAIFWAFGALAIYAFRLNQRLENAAHRDPLTGLGNRRALDAFATQKAADGGGDEGFLGCVCLDLDFFKEVNDTHGHAAGDFVLAESAHRIRRVAGIEQRGTSLSIFRIGGDEFVFFKRVEDPATLRALGPELCEELQKPLTFNGHSIKIGGSVGVSWSSGPHDCTALIQSADRALYRSKEAGRCCATFAEDLVEDATVDQAA